MISDWLLTVLRCPLCVQSQPGDDAGRLTRVADALVCDECAAQFLILAGYVDMRPAMVMDGKETVYNDPAADLDDPLIRAPVLSAGVRQWVLRLLLRPRPTDAILDIGCGNGKFAYWNRQAVAHLVGLDPAARFAPAALATVDLVQGDARALPFARGSFSGAYSVDVFEHLDLTGVRAHLRETRRILRPTGAYFCFSNTRERSWLNHLIDPGRRAAESLHRAGVVDRTRDHLRKGDHVKAVETIAALEDELATGGFRVAHLWFLNPVVATYLETLGFAIVEQRLARRNRRTNAASDTGADPAHGGIRDRAARTPFVRYALRVATALLALDVVFFRGVRTGPFFLLARPSHHQ
ncbi:MAG: class I SAM-dependent methyltransferase [Thermomicrobia bacterium]|nr:class I SAM-dependent methyltransferase [Thermomicrobia bacterium]